MWTQPGLHSRGTVTQEPNLATSIDGTCTCLSYRGWYIDWQRLLRQERSLRRAGERATPPPEHPTTVTAAAESCWSGECPRSVPPHRLCHVTPAGRRRIGPSRARARAARWSGHVTRRAVTSWSKASTRRVRVPKRRREERGWSECGGTRPRSSEGAGMNLATRPLSFSRLFVSYALSRTFL